MLIRLILFISLQSFSYVDLHAHLFASEGIYPLMRGNFFSDKIADSWDSLTIQKSNFKTLNESHFKLIVVSLYAHPLLNFDIKKSILRQIALAEEFVKRYPNWIIAKNSLEARDALTNGKRVLVLSLEGASEILETKEDIELFINKKNIRIVTLAHLIEDDLSGTSFFHFPINLINPWDYFKAHFLNSKENGILQHPIGLKNKGKKLITTLLSEGVWLDFTHLSDKGIDEIIPLWKNYKIPLLFTHTLFRRYYPAERAISKKHLEALRDTKGIIGIMPIEWELDFGIPMLKTDRCKGAFSVLVEQINHLFKYLKPEQVFWGSDINGLVPMMSGKCLSNEFQEGFFNIKHLIKLENEVSKKIKYNIFQSPNLNNFLDTWDQAEKKRKVIF